jgi:hypothetical protein
MTKSKRFAAERTKTKNIHIVMRRSIKSNLWLIELLNEHNIYIAQKRLQQLKHNISKQVYDDEFGATNQRFSVFLSSGLHYSLDSAAIIIIIVLQIILLQGIWKNSNLLIRAIKTFRSSHLELSRKR